MQFHTDVVECRWGEAEGTWRVRLRRQLPGQRPEEFDDYCHVLINACGALNNFKVSQSLWRRDEWSGSLTPASGQPRRDCMTGSKAG